MTDRHVIASHEATNANPPWYLTHLTDPSSGGDEYQLTCGDGWLVLDPRDPDDRAQMVEIGNALLAAAGVPDVSAVAKAAVELVNERYYHPEEGSEAAASNQAHYERLESAVLALPPVRAEAGK